MWWDRCRRVEVYLGPGLVGCRGLGDVISEAASGAALWAEVAGLGQGVEQLAAWFGHPETVRGTALQVRIRLASALARPFVIPGESGAKNRTEAVELARTTVRRGLGDAGEPRVWCGPWQAGRPLLAVGLHGQTWAHLQRLSSADRKRPVRVVSIRPWWNQVLDPVLDRSRSDKRILGWSLAEPDGIVFARVGDGDVRDIGFEGRKGHDPGWRLLRRRLAASWDDVAALEALDFDKADRDAADGEIGAAVVADEAGGGRP